MPEELERGDRLPDLVELVALGAGLGITASAIMRVWETWQREGEGGLDPRDDRMAGSTE
ncbi:MAG: hypothetical protein R6X02_11105 [Enhygromyxa sp.]